MGRSKKFQVGFHQNFDTWINLANTKVAKFIMYQPHGGSNDLLSVKNAEK